MNIDTNNAGSQQPNPGAGEGALTTDAANPTGQQATVPAVVDGQGEGGEKTGGDAGNQGDGKNAEGEGGTGDGQDKTGKPEELTGAPEAYADFTLPEGFVLEGDRKDATLALFRDLGLPQGKAQAAIDHFIKTVGEDAAVQQAAMEAAVAKKRDDWGIQAKAELGDKYDETVAYAKTAVHAMQNEKLVAAFDEQGWGNHPELIKAFGMFGKMMRDSPVDGIGSGGSASLDAKPWDVLYKDMK